jgi:hypothetical protein
VKCFEPQLSEKQMSLRAMQRFEKEVRRISPGRLENRQRLITVNNDKAQRKIDIAR